MSANLISVLPVTEGVEYGKEAVVGFSYLAKSNGQYCTVN